MNIKTVTTIDGMNTVDFGSAASRFFWFRYIGTSAVYVSGNSDITAGGDGVAQLAVGDSVCVEALGGKVYVLGACKVQIHNTGDKFCPFKNAPAQSGGEAVDAYTKTESDDKYAQKTDVVPYKMGMDFGTCTTAAETVIKSVTTLHKVAPALGAVFAVKFNNAVPAQARLNINGLLGYIQYRGSSIPNGVINAGDIATFIYYSSSGFNTFEILSVENGGNADTVGGKVPEKIFYDNGISADLNGATQSGCYAASPDTLNAPLSSWWLVDTMNFDNQFIVQKAHAIGDTAVTVSYIRNYANDVWSEWKEISTTPIKSTTFSSNSAGTGNFNLWAPSENKVPISIQFDNKPCYAVPFLYNNQMWLGSTINEVTRQPVTGTTVSGTVYYIEV